MSSSQSATLTQIWSGTCYLTPLLGAFIAGGASHTRPAQADRKLQLKGILWLQPSISAILLAARNCCLRMPVQTRGWGASASSSPSHACRC